MVASFISISITISFLQLQLKKDIHLSFGSSVVTFITNIIIARLKTPSSNFIHHNIFMYLYNVIGLFFCYCTVFLTKNKTVGKAERSSNQCFNLLPL